MNPNKTQKFFLNFSLKKLTHSTVIAKNKIFSYALFFLYKNIMRTCAQISHKSHKSGIKLPT